MPVHNIPHISPQAIYLCISDGIAMNTYGNHLQFPLRKTIQIPSNVQAFVSMSNFKCSAIWCNIGQFNNKLYYSISSEIGTTLEYSIPVDNYSISALVVQLNTDLADHSFVFTYDPLTFKNLIENSTFGYIIRDGENSVHLNLGLIVPTAQDTTHKATHCINLSGVQSVTIACPSLHLDSSGTLSGETSVLDRVNVDVLVGSTLSYSDSANNKYRIYENSVSMLEVRLSNQGQDLDMLGSVWYISLYTPQFLAPFNEFPSGDPVPVSDLKPNDKPADIKEKA